MTHTFILMSAFYQLANCFVMENARSNHDQIRNLSGGFSMILVLLFMQSPIRPHVVKSSRSIKDMRVYFCSVTEIHTTPGQKVILIQGQGSMPKGSPCLHLFLGAEMNYSNFDCFCFVFGNNFLRLTLGVVMLMHCLYMI